MTPKTTLLYLYYNNAPAFTHLTETGLPYHTIKKLFVDDASTPPLVIPPTWRNTTLIRISEDTPWNQPRANNIGLNHILEGRVVRLDIDHWFAPDDLTKLITTELPPRTVMRFPRIGHYKDGTTKHINTGKNIFMAHVEDLLLIGGYNECFCGNYGYEDGELFFRMSQNGFKVLIHESVHAHTTVDHGTRGLNRDSVINHAKFEAIKENYNKGTKTI
jgi:hypothetical protein